MAEKDSKVPIYIAIIVALLLVAAGAYVVLRGSTDQTPQGTTPVPTTKVTPEKTTSSGATPSGTVAATSSTPTPPKVETIKCELCHVNPQDIIPHVNGGKYCINCHGSQVHNIHIGPGTVGLSCETCHGFPPTIPTVEKGQGPGHYIICENCHASPPDSLKPSLGNLIVIHLSRGKYCTNCHGTDISAIHMKAIANASTQIANASTK
jgi:hypothetical protein